MLYVPETSKNLKNGISEDQQKLFQNFQIVGHCIPFFLETGPNGRATSNSFLSCHDTCDLQAGLMAKSCNLISILVDALVVVVDAWNHMDVVGRWKNQYF